MLVLLLLLALPLIALLLVLLLALLPLTLWQRYRVGSSRRRAWSWVLALGWWASLVSSGLFAVSVAAAGLFWPNAWLYSAVAWPAGVLLGALGHALTRFEATPEGLYYQSNRWLVLGLTLLVAARIALGAWQAWTHWRHGVGFVGNAGMAGPGSVVGVGGVLLGYFLAMAWGVQARLRGH